MSKRDMIHSVRRILNFHEVNRPQVAIDLLLGVI